MRRGELEGRLDTGYYLPRFRENIRQLRTAFPKIEPLSNYADVICGPFGSAIKFDDYIPAPGVPLLRISNLTDDGRIDESNLVFVRSELAAKLKRTQVQPGDLVISQRGTLGIPAVVPSTYTSWCISANLIAIKQPSIDRGFVQAFLSSRPGALQLERSQSGQVQSKITTGDVARVLIPKLDNDETLVRDLERARSTRRRQLKEADELLSLLSG